MATTEPLGFPTDPAMTTISKQSIAAAFTGADNPNYSVQNSYRVNANTIVAYSFAEHPLPGGLQTAVVDRAEGLVFCRQHTRHLFKQFMKNKILATNFQEECRRMLGFHENHALSFGNVCFMSTWGYEDGKSYDWIGLHCMNDYVFRKNHCLFVDSARATIFRIDDIPRGFSNRLAEVVTHNRLTESFFNDLVAERGLRVNKHSILYEERFVRVDQLHEATKHYTAHNLMEHVRGANLEVYGKRFARENGVIWSRDCHLLARQAVLRRRVFK
jgi:hypothetical protein